VTGYRVIFRTLLCTTLVFVAAFDMWLCRRRGC
jgi:hypothetical protein